MHKSRFHGGAFWWGFAFLCRNTLVAIATLIDPSQAFAQMFFLGAVLIFFLVWQVAVWPWMNEGLNVFIIDRMVSEIVGFLQI